MVDVKNIWIRDRGKSNMFPYTGQVEMMGLIGMGNNPMVGDTVAVAIEEAMNK